MPILQTVRFVHHVTRAEVAELRFPTSTTVGELKSVITRHLYEEEACPMRLFWKWFVDPVAGKVITEITEDDHGRTLREFIPEDYTVLCLEGPVTGSAESLGQVVGRVGAEMREMQLENACLKKKINELEQRVASVMFPCHDAYFADNSTTQEWNQIIELENAKRNALKLLELQPFWPTLNGASSVTLLAKPLVIETETQIFRFQFVGWGLFVLILSSLQRSNINDFTGKLKTALVQLRGGDLDQRYCDAILIEWFSAVAPKLERPDPILVTNLLVCVATFVDWLLVTGIMFHLCSHVTAMSPKLAFVDDSLEEAFHLIIRLSNTLQSCNTEKFANLVFGSTTVGLRHNYLGLFDPKYHNPRSQNKQILSFHLVKSALEDSEFHIAKEFTDRLIKIGKEHIEGYPFTQGQQIELLVTFPSVAALQLTLDADVDANQPSQNKRAELLVAKWLQNHLDAFMDLLHCKDFLLWANQGKFWVLLPVPLINTIMRNERNVGAEWVKIFEQTSRHAFPAIIISIAKNQCNYTDDELDALMEDLPENLSVIEKAPSKHRKALLRTELSDSKGIAIARLDAKKPFPQLVKEVAIELEFSDAVLKVLEEDTPESLQKIKFKSPPSDLKASVTKELKSIKGNLYEQIKQAEVVGLAKKLLEYRHKWPSVDKLSALLLLGKPLVIETDTEITPFELNGWGLLISMLQTVPGSLNPKDSYRFTVFLVELFRECLVSVKSSLDATNSEEDKQNVYSEIIDLFSVVPRQVQPKHAALFLNCCNNFVDWLLIAGIMCHLYGSPINEIKRKAPLTYNYSALKTIYSLIGKFSTAMPACNTFDFAAWVHCAAPADLQNQLLGLFSPKYVTPTSQEKNSLSFSLVTLSVENNLAVEQFIGVLLGVMKAKKEDHPFTVGQQTILLDTTMYPNETTVPSMVALKTSFDPYLLYRGDMRKEKARYLISYWVRSNFTNFVCLLLSPEFCEWATDTQKDFWAAMVSHMPALWRNGQIKGVAWLGQLPDTTLMALMTEELQNGGVQSVFDILMLPHNKGWAKRRIPERQKSEPLRITERDKSPAILLALMRPLIINFGRLTIAGSIWLGVALTAKDIQFPASHFFGNAIAQLFTSCDETPITFQLAIVTDIISESALKNRMATPELGDLFLRTHKLLLQTDIVTAFKTHGTCVEAATKFANFTRNVHGGPVKGADEFLDRYQMYLYFDADCRKELEALDKKVQLLKMNNDYFLPQ